MSSLGGSKSLVEPAVADSKKDDAIGFHLGDQLINAHSFTTVYVLLNMCLTFMQDHNVLGLREYLSYKDSDGFHRREYWGIVHDALVLPFFTLQYFLIPNQKSVKSFGNSQPMPLSLTRGLGACLGYFIADTLWNGRSLGMMFILHHIGGSLLIAIGSMNKINGQWLVLLVVCVGEFGSAAKCLKALTPLGFEYYNEIIQICTLVFNISNFAMTVIFVYNLKLCRDPYILVGYVMAAGLLIGRYMLG